MAKRSKASGVSSLVDPAKLSKKWRELLALIPGYDPIKTAGDARFDAGRAQMAMDFFPECLQHVEGAAAGKPFVLERWQQAVVANLFGWMRTDLAGRLVRRYRECLLLVPRKSGKTPMAAAIGLYVLFCDAEIGQQNFIAAASRDQAGKLFRHCELMVKREPELANRCRVFGGQAPAGQSRSIVKTGDLSFLRIIAADADTEHGSNTHLAIVDELHAQPNRKLMDVIQTSFASHNRPQPLFLCVTTADYKRPGSICNEKYDYACRVRDGVIDDPAYLPVIYELTADEDWTDEANWRKANPNLGVSVSLEYLRSECRKAQENPALENTFRRLHLNTQTEQDVRAIPMDRWDSVSPPNPRAWRDAAEAELAGRECWGGLDLGSTSDLTALALVFKGGVGPNADQFRATVLPWFWCPHESARKRSRQDRVPYETWLAQGWMLPTEGNTTDYDKVRADIDGIANRYGLVELRVDRTFQGAQLCTQLMADGVNVVAFGQGFYSMAAPTKAVIEMATAGALCHGGNPVLRWMASNASVEMDAAGSLKFSKRKSAEKIDGIISATMAVAGVELSGAHRRGSFYETHDVEMM